MCPSLTLTNTPSTVFGWLIADASRMQRGLQLIRLGRVVRVAFARFVAGRRAAPFSAQFVGARVAPLVARSIELGERLAPDTVAEAWLASLPPPAPAITPALMAELRAAAAELLAAVEEALNQGGEPGVHLPEPDPAAAARFAEAVRAGSPLALDWLWLAMQLTGTDERRYCFERVLAVNPTCEIARVELAALDAHPAPLSLAAGA
jgi:hypothetical protein